MLGIIIGILAIVLGAKAFTAKGLPVTKTKSLKGTAGIIVGIFCILLGLLFLADAVYAIMTMVH